MVEIKYGLTVAKPYLLSKISPPKQEMVDRLRNPPDSTWTLKHDAQLLKYNEIFFSIHKFLNVFDRFVYSCSEFKNSGSSNLGVLSPYVDRIEVSSSTEGESDDQVSQLRNKLRLIISENF